MNNQIDTWFKESKNWFKCAGEIIKTRLQENITINTKSHANDLVTNIDKEVENYFKQQIGTIQGHRLFGEEGDFVNDLNEFVWILDPVDGTTNLVTTGRDFVISLALYHNGKAIFGIIYDVMRNEFFYGIHGQGAFVNDVRIPTVKQDLTITEQVIICDYKEIISYPRVSEMIAESRGHRRYGSAALEIVHVATGRAGAFIHMMLSPWDIAAAKIIAEECGVIYSRTDGTSVNILEKGSSLAAPPQIHKEIILKCFS